MKQSTKKMLANAVMCSCVGWTYGRTVNRAASIELNTPMAVGTLIAGVVTLPVVAHICAPVIGEIVDSIIPDEIAE